MTKLFQLYEDDLAELERIVPELMNRLVHSMDNRARTQLRRVKDILSNVRWSYGPPTEVEIVDGCQGENGPEESFS